MEKPGLSDLELRNIGKQYSELGHLVSLVEKRKSVEKQLEELITLELDEKKKYSLKELIPQKNSNDYFFPFALEKKGPMMKWSN